MKNRRSKNWPTKWHILLLSLLSLLMITCTPEPEPIIFGSDMCVYCKMMIADTRYGGELVTQKGKTYKYDSVECLAASYLEQHIPLDDVHSLWVIDFNRPEFLINAENALYLKSKDLHSPMGLNLSAFSEESTVEKVAQLFMGVRLNWQQVQNEVNKKWLQKN